MTQQVIDYLLLLVNEHKSAYYVRYANTLSRTFAMDCTVGMVKYWLDAHGLKRKRLTKIYAE